jgi:hypothetical protein
MENCEVQLQLAAMTNLSKKLDRQEDSKQMEELQVRSVPSAADVTAGSGDVTEQPLTGSDYAGEY